jgi:hypothetical protein
VFVDRVKDDGGLKAVRGPLLARRLDVVDVV